MSDSSQQQLISGTIRNPVNPGGMGAWWLTESAVQQYILSECDQVHVRHATDGMRVLVTYRIDLTTHRYRSVVEVSELPSYVRPLPSVPLWRQSGWNHVQHKWCCQVSQRQQIACLTDRLTGFGQDPPCE